MEHKKNFINEVTLEQFLGIKHNHAKNLFKQGYYKIINIVPLDAEGYGPYLPERFQATVHFRESSSQEYPNETEQLHRLNPLLNKVAKHNLIKLGLGKPIKSLKYFEKIAAIGEVKIIEISRGDSYEIEWELVPF